MCFLWPCSRTNTSLNIIMLGVLGSLYWEKRGEIGHKGSNGWPTWWKNVGHRENDTRRTLNYHGIECSINGTYRHIQCKRVSETRIPFDSLTCNFCKRIPNCDDFRMRLYRESRSNMKRHGRDTRKGRRLDHLNSKLLQEKQMLHIG